MRVPLSKKLRFEVFKRDSFRCQYCGVEAPSAILEVDHIDPVAAGGTDDIINLITSCRPCNSGKGARPLNDQSAARKAKAQLDELQERREQLEMMIEWKRGLANAAMSETAAVEKFWQDRLPGWTVKDAFKLRLRKLVKKYGAMTVIEAIDKAADAYLVLDESGNATEESWDRIAETFAVMCDPELSNARYVCGILRNRFGRLAANVGSDQITLARRRGVSFDDLRGLAVGCESWDEWESKVSGLPG